MHDGYLFTLGICGTASGNSPAPELLGAMLRAIPPVKRAALLGEVLLLDDPAHFADPMINMVLADVADAELLLIVSPTPGGRLPLRLANLLEQAAPMALRGTHALIVLISEEDAAPHGAERAISGLLAHSGLHLSELIIARADEPLHTFEAAAQRAYRLARELAPDALPH